MFYFVSKLTKTHLTPTIKTPSLFEKRMSVLNCRLQRRYKMQAMWRQRETGSWKSVKQTNEICLSLFATFCTVFCNGFRGWLAVFPPVMFSLILAASWNFISCLPHPPPHPTSWWSVTFGTIQNAGTSSFTTTSWKMSYQASQLQSTPDSCPEEVTPAPPLLFLLSSLSMINTVLSNQQKMWETVVWTENCSK